MSVERREFLRLAALVAGAGLSACTPIYRIVGEALDGPLGWIEGDGPAFRLLGRLTYGPTMAERMRVAAMGIEAWLEEQLDPGSSSDARADLALRPLASVGLDSADLAAWEKQDVVDELKRGALLRRIYSRRQVLEILVEFWSDHFNISVEKGACWYLKPIDDRDVIRRHAFGNFRELLQASAHSPAMLVYLDNQANDRRAPNENYARELLELHTLGVQGGYSQRDVMELARCLTGWSVKDRFWRGQFVFRDELHDTGRKTVLGMDVLPGGVGEAEAIVDHLALHPKTAQRLARKMARRFLEPGQDLPESLVARAAEAFLASGGEIRPMLRTILFDGLLPAGSGLTPRFKRPADFVASAIRMLDGWTTGGGPILDHLAKMGHPLFEWPTPDGPPEDMASWQGGLFARWDFADEAARGRIDGVEFDWDAWRRVSGAATIEQELDGLSNILLGARLDDSLRDLVLEAAGNEEDARAVVLAGLMASPAFQWR